MLMLDHSIPVTVSASHLTASSTSHQLSDVQGGSLSFFVVALHTVRPVFFVNKDFFIMPESTTPAQKITEFLAVEEWLDLKSGKCLGCNEHIVHLEGKHDVADITHWDTWEHHREQCDEIERKIAMGILREFDEIHEERDEKGEAFGYRQLKKCADPLEVGKKRGPRAIALKKFVTAGIKRKSLTAKKFLGGS